MIVWQDDVDVYLHRDTVDFRKAINGLSLIVSETMNLSPFDRALFVFCNRRQTQLKVLYWDQTGFVLWQKRLEKAKFPWPKKSESSCVQLSHEQWCWLLRGLDFSKLQPHQPLTFSSLC